MHQLNSILAGAPPHTPLRKLTELPQTLYLQFRGLTSKEKKGEKENRGGKKEEKQEGEKGEREKKGKRRSPQYSFWLRH